MTPCEVATPEQPYAYATRGRLNVLGRCGRFAGHWLWCRRRLLMYALWSLPLFAISECLAYWVRFEGAIDGRTAKVLLLTLPWVVMIKLTVFGWLRVYHSWHRDITFYDLVVTAQAAVASSLVLVLTAHFLWPELVVPRSVYLLDGIGTLTLLGSVRALSRLVNESNWIRGTTDTPIRALIVGANDSGELLLRAIRRNSKLSYQIVGIITSGEQAGPLRFVGLPVLGTLADLAAIARDCRIEVVLLMADELAGRDVRQVMDACLQVGAEVKVLPSYEQLLNNRLDVQPRTISIADLLRRAPVKLDLHKLHGWIDDRVLMVTGAAGSIGSEICRQLLQFQPRQLIVLDRSENGQFFLQRELQDLAPNVDLRVHVADVGDHARMVSLMQRYRPEVVFHAAAYKHVPLMEDNPGEAVKNIVTVTRTLADIAGDCGVGSFVMISTDKAVNPTSVMGACKRVAELYVQSMSQASACRFVTVRFGNVLDSAGSVIPIFREQIRRGGPVTVTHPDMRRYFMMIPEASQLVIQAGAMGQGGEVFVLNMGTPVRIVDLACEMIKLSGFEVGRDIDIEFSGMRLGEKLYEELHNVDEMRSVTVHPDIMVVGAAAIDRYAALTMVGELEHAVERGDDAVIAALQKFVPQYRPFRTEVTRLTDAA